MKRFPFVIFGIILSLSCVADDIKYHLDDILSITVSDKYELRKDSDAFTKELGEIKEKKSQQLFVFQQKGLSCKDSSAFFLYSRILIDTISSKTGDFPAYNDSAFSDEDFRYLENLCNEELADGQVFLISPHAKIEKIDKGFRIKISYQRSGLHGPVSVYILWYFNHYYAIKISASYRDSEKDLWQTSIENAINSIQLDNPYTVQSVSEMFPPSYESTPSPKIDSSHQTGFLLGLFLGIIGTVLIFILLKKNKNNDRMQNSKQQVSSTHEIQEIKPIKENDIFKTKSGTVKHEQPRSNDIQEIKTTTVADEMSEPTSTQGQKIVQTKYDNPNIKNQNGYYCFSLFPAKQISVFPYRRKRAQNRGYCELSFENKLRHCLADLTNYQVLGDISILPVDGSQPFEPDIAIIEKDDLLGIRIDIEIDEPYTGSGKVPIHYIGCGDEYRDSNFCRLGWIVIRFSEKQIFSEADKCINYIRYILSVIDHTSTFEQAKGFPQKDKKWSSTEATIMAAKKYRESYLGHIFKDVETDTKLTIKDIKQTDIEKEAAKHIKTIALPKSHIINIDKSTTTFSQDNRLSFEPKEHIYILDDTIKLKAISDIIDIFFHPFDILEQSEKYAEKNQMEQSEVIEMWNAKGEESRQVGKFLHEQIENYLNGRHVIYDSPVSYDRINKRIEKTVSIKTEFNYFLNFLQQTEIKPFRSEWRIFDEGKKIAGTIDLLCRNGSKYDIYDWKRSKKASPSASVWRYGIKGLENVPDIPFYHYAIQQNLYKYILEKDYGISIGTMYLVILHPECEDYRKYRVPEMKKEVKIITEFLQLPFI